MRSINFLLLILPEHNLHICLLETHINASDDDYYDSNDVINENSSNGSSDENDIIRRSFKFSHDGSLENEWNNNLDLPISQEQQK